MQFVSCLLPETYGPNAKTRARMFSENNFENMMEGKITRY